MLTNLRGVPFVLNCELIETITSNPDTTILLTNGSLHIVSEPKEVVIEKTIAYKRKIFGNLTTALN
jgi:flagellar protein FlbD